MRQIHEQEETTSLSTLYDFQGNGRHFFIAFIVNKRAHGRKSEQFIFAVS